MSPSNCYPEKAPQVNELLDTLSHHLRRELILYLESHPDGTVTPIEDVVSHLENRVPEETPESLSMKLNHTHLPKLAERGWLDYDSRGGEIRYEGHGRANHWLEQVRDIF